MILLAGVLTPLVGIWDNVLRNVRVDWLVPAVSLLRTPPVVLVAVGIDLRLISEIVVLLHSPLIVLRLVAPLLVGLRLVAPLVILLISAPLVALLLLVSPSVGLDVALAEGIVVGLIATSADLEQDLACSLALVVQLNNF